MQGRLLTEADLNYLRGLRTQHPRWLRRQLSDDLVQHWPWRNEAGRPKDMAARTLLLKLQAKGLIDLPAPRTSNGNKNRRAQPPLLAQPEWLSTPPEPSVGPLRALQPVNRQLVADIAQRRRVTQLLRPYHYQGFSGAVGQNVQYLARDAHGRDLAVMVYAAAAWKVAPRDEFIGWSVEQRRQGLPRITNQQRFLILPWVRVEHLASHLLALSIQRLSRDWQARYGHPVWLAETFVQEDRFTGTSYRAAGWIRVGQTTGRTRQDRHHCLETPIKSIWLKPLHPRFNQYLTTL